MSSTTATNGDMRFDADGDFVGYDIPEGVPVSLSYEWHRKWGRDDELVYRVKWANGVTADLFSLPLAWNHLKAEHAERNKAESLAHLSKVDEALVEARKPLVLA